MTVLSSVAAGGADPTGQKGRQGFIITDVIADIYGSVDTHQQRHVAAVVDHPGRVIEVV